MLKDLEEKSDFKELTGFYKSTGGIVYLSQIGDRLASILPDNMNPLSTAILFDHEKEMTFTSPNEMVSAKIREKISFIDGENREKILLESDSSKVKRFKFEHLQQTQLFM